jgi:hypothetical protein
VAIDEPDSQPAPLAEGEPPGLALRSLAALAFFHLILTAAFLLGNPSHGTAAESVLHVYQSLSGTWRNYAFFAPDVASGYRAAFVLDDAPGAGSTFVDLIGDNREITFRYDVIIAAGMKSANTREIFAQSWAALLLGTRPDVSQVTVIVDRLDMPGMAAYRAGRRLVWKRIYVGVFDRRTRPSSP